MATINQVATLARVSTATVSHVLNNSANVSPKLRERVMKVVRQLNYHPNYHARSLRTRESKTVAMIIPDITNPFFPKVVRGAEDALVRQGYTLIVGNSDYQTEKEETYFRTFCEKRVDGLLLTINPTRPPDYLRRHNFTETPVVYINRVYRGVGGDAVLTDNVGGSREAVRHLLQCGHRRIGIITGPLNLTMAKRRLRGYEHALAECGIGPEADLIREGHYDVKSGYEQARALLSLTARPTALFVSNGLMTMGCVRAILESGLRCPEEIAVVSFDDLELFDIMRPRISAVEQPDYDLGSTAAEMLVKRITDRTSGPCRRKVLKTKLIVRDSSDHRLESHENSQAALLENPVKPYSRV